MKSELRPRGQRVMQWALRLILAVLAAGCDGEDPNIPHVVYPDQLPLPDPKQSVVVPDWTIGEPPLDLSMETPLVANESVEFRGRVIPTDAIDYQGDVAVAFVRDGKTGAILGNLGLESAQPEDGAYTYSVILRAPPSAERWRVEISWQHFEVGTRPLAGGEIDVVQQ